MFEILPAIDMKDGKCVRLRQGRAEDATVYGEDPVEQAKAWAAGGARWIHAVDLTGAFEGAPRHVREVAGMVAAVGGRGVRVEIGGGLRTDADLERLAETGAARMILGTRALEDGGRLAELAARWGERLAVGIDAREGKVQVRGWTETSGVTAEGLAERVAAAGVKTLIYTDTATDGMLKGPNVPATAAVCRAVEGSGCAVVASGGITTADDIRRLRGTGRGELAGAIVGKALYEGRTTLAELLAAAAE